MIDAKNDALRQSALNLQIARAYLAGADRSNSTRTWQQAIDAIVETKQGPKKLRWRWAVKEKFFDCLRHRVITETQAEYLFQALQAGTVSTNAHLRKLHNFVLDMGWLPYPIVPKPRNYNALSFSTLSRREEQPATKPPRNSIIGPQVVYPFQHARVELCRSLIKPVIDHVDTGPVSG